MNLDDLQVYQMAMSIGERVWRVVSDWAEFPRNSKLVDEEVFSTLNNEIDALSIKLNNYINSIGKQRE